MRKGLLVILLIVASLAKAQVGDTAHRCSLTILYDLGVPRGEFAAGKNDHYFAGQSRPSSGLVFGLGVQVTGHWKVAFSISDIVYNVDEGRYRNQLVSQYTDANYFSTININKSAFEVTRFALSGSYLMKFPFAIVEPYVELGIGIGNSDFEGNLYTVHRKRKNDNYSDDVYGNMVESGSYFAPGAGVLVTKQLWKPFYLSAGVQYNHGVAKLGMRETVTDFLGNETVNRRAYSQPIDVVNVRLGITIRFFRWRVEQKVVEPQIEGDHSNK